MTSARSETLVWPFSEATQGHECSSWTQGHASIIRTHRHEERAKDNIKRTHTYCQVTHDTQNTHMKQVTRYRVKGKVFVERKGCWGHIKRKGVNAGDNT